MGSGKRTFRSWCVIAVPVPFAFAIACGTLTAGGEAPPIASETGSDAPPGVVDGGGDSDASTLCQAPTYNAAGCLCEVAGASQACFHGVPGDAATSLCAAPGSTTCVPSNGELRWSECVGGSVPAPADKCFNAIDDDCDGVIDNGCPGCTDSVDLCYPDQNGSGTPFPTNVYTTFTIPPNPIAIDQKFDLYIVTKDKPLDDTGLEKTPGICYGGGLRKPCFSAGTKCAGWKVQVFHGISESSAKTYQYVFHDPEGPTGCEGASIATVNVVVQ